MNTPSNAELRVTWDEFEEWAVAYHGEESSAVRVLRHIKSRAQSARNAGVVEARLRSAPAPAATTALRCECHRCIKENDLRAQFGTLSIPLSGVQMIVCPECGNKRCPKASDHRLACEPESEEMQSCENCRKEFPLSTMNTSTDGCWLCQECIRALAEDDPTPTSAATSVDANTASRGRLSPHRDRDSVFTPSPDTGGESPALPAPLPDASHVPAMKMLCDHKDAWEEHGSLARCRRCGQEAEWSAVRPTPDASQGKSGKKIRATLSGDDCIYLMDWRGDVYRVSISWDDLPTVERHASNCQTWPQEIVDEHDRVTSASSTPAVPPAQVEGRPLCIHGVPTGEFCSSCNHSPTFTGLSVPDIWAHSSVGSERRSSNPQVEGSSPSAPTTPPESGLRECPFCGKAVEARQHQKHGQAPHWSIICSGAHDTFGFSHSDKHVVVKWWNTRPSQPVTTVGDAEVVVSRDFLKRLEDYFDGLVKVAADTEQSAPAEWTGPLTELRALTRLQSTGGKP